MTSQVFKIYRETALPSTLQPYALYFIKGVGNDYVEQYATDSTGQAIRVFSKADVEALITSHLANIGKLTVVDDISSRDMLNDTIANNAEVYVINASADDTVSTGGARYLRHNSNWVKVSETESQDLVLSWDNLHDKPNVTAQQIETAVTQSHTHGNKSELDKIGEENGNLTYGGNPVKTAWESVAW